MDVSQAFDYRNSGFANCPYCKSDDLEVGPFQNDGFYMDLECNKCKMKWRDELSITHVSYYDENTHVRNVHSFRLEDRM